MVLPSSPEIEFQIEKARLEAEAEAKWIHNNAKKPKEGPEEPAKPGQLSREEFKVACIAALKTKKADPASKTAREVAEALCYDYPAVEDSECVELALKLREPEWRLAQRLPSRCIDGVLSLTVKGGRAEKPSAAKSELAATLGVVCVEALLEMPRREVVRFGAGPYEAHRKHVPAPPASAKMKNLMSLDYSKWDNLEDESDDSEPEEIDRARIAALDTEDEDVRSAPLLKSAKDAALLVRHFAKCAESSALSTLDANAWISTESLDLVARAKNVATILRGDKKCGWLCDGSHDDLLEVEFLRQEYSRYVFLIRDAYLGCPQCRSAAVSALESLAMQKNGGARSARDGGVALVALGSLASQHALEGTREQHLRACCLRLLPGLAELGRALAREGGEGDEALLGALLALSELGAGVRVFGDRNMSNQLRSSFDDGCADQILQSGLLSALVALSQRLAKQRSTVGGEAERRLHRLLVALCAQSPRGVGAFMLRTGPLIEMALSVEFFERCEHEAALWAVRIQIVAMVNGTSPPKKCGEALRRAFSTNTTKMTDLAARARELVGHLAATPEATRAWFEMSPTAAAAVVAMRSAIVDAAAEASKAAAESPEDEARCSKKADFEESSASPEEVAPTDDAAAPAPPNAVEEKAPRAAKLLARQLLTVDADLRRDMKLLLGPQLAAPPVCEPVPMGPEPPGAPPRQKPAAVQNLAPAVSKND